ncbi:MAG: TIGR03067 domain-containing protein, partial [Gemmataceae bacterium]|nr:TIGR03067 domain-containing protein [Gemmataceae bacterium]
AAGPRGTRHPGRPAPPTLTAERDETAAVVQDEVDRLAAKYRDPVVLCFYEGHSHAEAAARLGWPIGTVASRLARAKDRLRDRLTRRGVALSAVGLSAARVDAGLIRTTLTTVLGPAGRVPPGVLTLTNGVVSAMRLSSLKLMAAGSAAAVVLTVGVFAAHGPGGSGAGGTGPDGRASSGGSRSGAFAHLHALHDHLYRWWKGVRAEDAGKKAAEEELKALEGEWRIKSLTADGKEVPADDLAATRLTIKGDEMEQREAGGDRVERVRVRVAPGENPKHFDLTALTGPEAVRGKTAEGIYKRDGDTLTFCHGALGAPGQERPKEFKGGAGLSLVVLERVKADKPAAADADKAAVEKALKALEGEWRIKKLEAGGKEAPPADFAGTRLTLKGDEMEQREAGRDRTERVRVRVAPGEDPKHFDLTALTGPEAVKGKTARGIYKQDGDTLTFCHGSFGAPEEDRPKKFEPGERVSLVVLERVKGEKDELAALAGEWKVTALPPDGVATPADAPDKMRWTITDKGEVTMDDGDGRPPGKARLAVAPAEAPAHITMTATDGPKPEIGRAIEGVYFRTGDKLLIAFADPKAPGANRPAAVKPGDGVAYIALERKKK